MHIPFSVFLLLGVPLSPSPETLGIKMTIQFGQTETSSQRTVYRQEDRKREEYRNSYGETQSDGTVRTRYGPRLASIVRCDSGQMFELNLDSSEYTVAPYPPKPFTKEEMEKRGLPTRITYLSDKATLRIEVTATDTGERKQMFGRTARRVITIRTQTPLEGSRSEPQETVTDGWYIDLSQRLSCDRKWPKNTHAYTYGHLEASGTGQPAERLEFVTNGSPEIGFALVSTATIKGGYRLPDGTRKQTEQKSQVLVTALEEGPLDPALFEIPPGFKHVDQIERNPPVSESAQPKDFCQRLKAGIARLFNR